MQDDYRTTLVEQVRKYAPSLAQRVVDALREKVVVGELSIAAADFVSALVRAGVPVAAEHVPILRWLLESVTLPPDTPADLTDRLTVA
ncbi:hypothetical protein [Glycomyces algeriensis]|uniref:Uncharacterized protein n=1 Tax=Glycomyces algeriensis TaxID=256037 RepID=A0A9W6G865_9ACTN|nr:hypothetical protein [Glycomyces algeriensis]MDA1367917.1 hypothetical protein [Glycomyces algeriensis]MDR7349456.1 leucyl aminopeptidase (aminopeptidase T) [Glycomyces algeriensis]GLI42160.1 hypothetical protein GALLR39Z86_20100 [Glycomyces algeriensis]